MRKRLNEQVHQINIEKGRTRCLKVLGERSLLHLCCVKSPPLIEITPATVHVFECVFYIFIYIYTGSKNLVRLLFFLRPSASSPLFVCLLLCGLVTFVVLGVP